MDAEHPAPPLVLTHRLPPADGASGEAASTATNPPAGWLRLRLSAEERTRLRGLRHSVCGRRLLLQLPRGEALRPGERLRGGEPTAPAEGGEEDHNEVVVEAAPESLLVVRAGSAETLMRAAYHLGNRHVALEVRARELRLLDDPVLADLLSRLGLELERRQLPFLPEGGAYGAGGHHHHPLEGHGDEHGHAPAEAHR